MSWEQLIKLILERNIILPTSQAIMDSLQQLFSYPPITKIVNKYIKNS